LASPEIEPWEWRSHAGRAKSVIIDPVILLLPLRHEVLIYQPKSPPFAADIISELSSPRVLLIHLRIKWTDECFSLEAARLFEILSGSHAQPASLSAKLCL
jgi:hypothetical protein